MKKLLLPLAGIIWAVAILTGSLALVAYAARPGGTGMAPEQWPATTRLQPAADSATLVMFLHPKCPCSRASLEELARLMAHCQDHVSAWAVFTEPAGCGEDWVKSGLWSKAAAIPGVSTICDRLGREAATFRAKTSGDVVLYDSRGRLAFHGGITMARGHEGDNAGRSSIEALLSGEPPSESMAPVFGCGLFAKCRKMDHPWKR